MRWMAMQQHARPVEASHGKSTIFPAICWNTAGMPAMSAADALPLPAFACSRPGSKCFAAWRCTCTAVDSPEQGLQSCILVVRHYFRNSQIIIARADLVCPHAVRVKVLGLTLRRL